MTDSLPIKVKSIGHVRNTLNANSMSHENIEHSQSQIEILPEFQECLKGIEDCKFLAILFWMDRVPEEERFENSCFTNSRPKRPNPIGVTIVPLLKQEGNILIVEALDALDGSPVLDIKAYKPWSFNRTDRAKWRLPDINQVKPQRG